MARTTPQDVKPEETEKKKEDRGLYLQLPYYVIDTLDMSESAKMGFIHFCRLYNKKDKTIEFRGYYRGLARDLGKSPTHTIAIVDQWVACNIISREETVDGIILQVNTAILWEKNKLHKETHSTCPQNEQQRLYTHKPETSTVHSIDSAVNDINTAVHKICCSVYTMDSNEREKTATRLLDLAKLLDSFSVLPEESPEQPSEPPQEEKNQPTTIAYSQSELPPPEEKKDKVEVSQSQWLSEKQDGCSTQPLQENVASSGVPATVEVSTAVQNSVPVSGIPDFRADLNQKDFRELTPVEKKRLEAREKQAETARIKGREQDLWRMAERIAGVIVETTYAKQSIQAMAKTKMSLEDIEIIMQKFADAGQFDLTSVANYLPKYASRKQRNQSQDANNVSQFPGVYRKPEPQPQKLVLTANGLVAATS